MRSFAQFLWWLVSSHYGYSLTEFRITCAAQLVYDALLAKTHSF